MHKKIKNVILVCGVAAMWAWFYKVGPFKKDNTQLLTLSKNQIDLELPAKPMFQLSSGSLSEIRRCFQGSEKLKSLLQKPSFQIQDLKEVKDIELKEFEQIHIHFNFEGKSLHMVFEGKKAEDLKGNLHLFQVSADGFEVMRPLPAPWLEMKPLEIFQVVKSEFPVTQLQKRIHWQIDGNTDLRFSDENGELKDLAIITGRGSQGALTLHCKPENGPLNCQCALSI